MICRMLCAAAALLVFTSACGAEKAFIAGDAGLDLSGELSIHYPALTGSGDAALLEQINELIQEKCRIGEYLTRAAQLLSGGDLRTEWKGEILGDVFSCAVSASGAIENTRPAHAWTAGSVDLRDGHEIVFTELFADAEEAREWIGTYLEETVAPELSPLLLNSELTPLPETFFLDRTGLTLLYPAEQDMSGDSIPNRIGVEDMITLSERSVEQLRAAAAEGTLTGIPAKIGDSMQELTDRWHTLTDPDGFEGGRLFALEGGCFRGVYLMTDDLSRGWE